MCKHVRMCACVCAYKEVKARAPTQCAAVCCSLFLCRVAVCCSVQHNTTHCNTLQEWKQDGLQHPTRNLVCLPPCTHTRTHILTHTHTHSNKHQHTHTHPHTLTHSPQSRQHPHTIPLLSDNCRAPCCTFGGAFGVPTQETRGVLRLLCHTRVVSRACSRAHVRVCEIQQVPASAAASVCPHQPCAIIRSSRGVDNPPKPP